MRGLVERGFEREGKPSDPGEVERTLNDRSVTRDNNPWTNPLRASHSF